VAVETAAAEAARAIFVDSAPVVVDTAATEAASGFGIDRSAVIVVATDATDAASRI